MMQLEQPRTTSNPTQEAFDLVKCYLLQSGPSYHLTPVQMKESLMRLGEPGIHELLRNIEVWPHEERLIRVVSEFGVADKPHTETESIYARMFVPTLTKHFQEFPDNASLSRAIRDAFVAIGPDAEAAIPELVGAFSYDRSNYCEDAARALAGIGKGCIGALRRCLETGSRQEQHYALETARLLGRDAGELLPVLERLALSGQHEDSNLRNALTAVKEWRPAERKTLCAPL